MNKQYKFNLGKLNFMKWLFAFLFVSVFTFSSTAQTTLVGSWDGNPTLEICVSDVPTDMLSLSLTNAQANTWYVLYNLCVADPTTQWIIIIKAEFSGTLVLGDYAAVGQYKVMSYPVLPIGPPYFYADPTGTAVPGTGWIYEEPTVTIDNTEFETCSLEYDLLSSPTPNSGCQIATIAWTLVTGAGNAIFSDDATADPTVTVDAYGEYTFQVEVTNGTCSSVTDQVTIYFYDIPQNVNAGTDGGSCTLEYSLNPSFDSVDYGTPTEEWSKSSGPGDATFTVNDVEVTVAGVYKFVYSVTNGPCDPVTDTVQITFAAPVADAGDDDEMGECAGQEVTLDGSGTDSYPTPNFSYLWAPDTYLDDATLAAPTFSGAPDGTYTLTLTITDDFTCTDSDEVVITVYNAPEAYVSGDTTIGECAGQEAYLYGNTSTGEQITYSWDPTDYLDDATLADPTFSGAPDGTYNYTLTVTDRFTCESTSSTVTIIVDPLPTAAVGNSPVAYGVNADDFVGACSGQELAIDNAAATGTATLTYLWTGSGASYLDDDEILQPVFDAYTPGTGSYDLTLTVTDTYGCTADDNFIIYVDDLPVATVGGPYTDGQCNDQYPDACSSTGTGIEYEWTGSETGNLTSTTDCDPTWNDDYAAGTYTLTITITDDYGCDDSETTTVEVVALPEPVIAGPTDLNWEEVGTYTLTPSNPANDYAWDVYEPVWGEAWLIGDESMPDYTEAWGWGDFTVIVSETDVYNCTGYDSLEVDVNQPDIWGWLMYDNQYETPMNDADIYFSPSGSTTSRPEVFPYPFDELYFGYFETFDGADTIASVIPAHQVGGINATDALLAQLHAVGSVPDAYSDDASGYLRNERKEVADVSNNGMITAYDALLIRMFAVGMINTFAAGDWYARVDEVVEWTEYGNDEYYLLMLCYGDVNKSYVPVLNPGGPLKEAGIIYTDGLMNVTKGESFKLPVQIDRSALVGAFTINLEFNSDMIDVKNVVSNFGEDLVYTISGNTIKIAWSDYRGISLNETESIVELEVVANADITPEMQLFTYNASSEFADAEGEPVQMNLKMSALNTTSTLGTATLLGNRPNPFNSTTEIEYVTSASGTVTLTVYNSFGNPVATLVNEVQAAGNYKVAFNRGDLAPGVYTYTLQVNGESKTRKMVITE